MKDKTLLFYEKIIDILRTPNGLAGKLYLTIEDKIIKVEIMNEDEKGTENFFEIDTKNKILNFNDYPKSSLMEKKCIALAKDMNKNGYKLGSLADFVKRPRFKSKSKDYIEISLY
jgi:hypothetical protein